MVVIRAHAHHGSVAETFPTGHHFHGLPQDPEVVAEKPRGSPGAVCLDVGEVESDVSGRLHNALVDLRRARPPGWHDVAVVVPGGHLRRDHRWRPGAWADEAHFAAKDVEELRKLVEVPRLEDMTTGPGQVPGIRLEEPGMPFIVTLTVENIPAKHAELQEVELTTSRVPALPIEQCSAIPRGEHHVEAHRCEHDREEGREEDDESNGDTKVEKPLRPPVHHRLGAHDRDS
jgi:hypothetical protein